METLRTSIEFLTRGGPIMVLLFLTSLIGLALIIERFRALRKPGILPERLIHEIDDLLEKEKHSDALAVAKASEAAVARIYVAGLAKRDRGREKVQMALESSGKKEAQTLEKHLDSLGTIAAVAPLLGLLGTVTGMISTFAVIRIAGVGDPLKLSGGISEALITTAGGLAVGIPALVFQRYFQHRVDQYLFVMEEEAEKVLESVTEG